jgi:hypothetical protein
LSDDADHDNVADDAETPPAASPTGTDGATRSGHALVDALVVVTGDTFPAESTAATPNVYVVPHKRPVTPKLVPDTEPTCTPFRNTR